MQSSTASRAQPLNERLRDLFDDYPVLEPAFITGVLTFLFSGIALGIATFSGVSSSLGTHAGVPLMFLAALGEAALVGAVWLVLDRYERPEADLLMKVALAVACAALVYVVVLRTNTVTLISIGYANLAAALAAVVAVHVIAPRLDRGVSTLSEAFYG